MTKYLQLILGFVLTIQIGCFLTEKVMQYTASRQGYNAFYSGYSGRLSFTNPDMQAAFKAVMTIHNDDPDIYKKSRDWELLLQKDRADRAKIVLSGKLFTSLVSVIGLIFYFYRRRKGIPMGWKDWIGLLCGLFFMRDVLLGLFELSTGAILCHDARLWEHLGLPVFASFRILTLLGLVLFGFILYCFPKQSRGMFVLSGLIGTMIGGALWILYTGRLLL